MPLPDKSDLASFAGPIVDYSPVIDPTTDEPAIARNFYVNDVAQMGRVIQRAIFSFVGVNGGNPTDPPSGFVHDAVWGNSVPYKPAITRTGEGIWLATFVTTVRQASLYSLPAASGGGLNHSVNFGRAFAQCQCSDGTLRHAVAEVLTANTIRIRGFLANGTADDLTGQIVTCWGYF